MPLYATVIHKALFTKSSTTIILTDFQRNCSIFIIKKKFYPMKSNSRHVACIFMEIMSIASH